MAHCSLSAQKGCLSARGNRPDHSNGAIQNHSNDRASCPIRIQHTVSRCTHSTGKTIDASYLIDGNIVTRLLKAGGVVVPVPHDNPHLVENNSTNQLVGALDLHYYGHDVLWGLEKK